MDAIEDNYDNMSDYLENEKDAYSDIIDAQKEILQLKKEQNDYEKDIADKTKDISSIESRMAELSKAASTGDRQANSELQKLNEDLADKKEDLSDTQSDHEFDLANDALDKALDDNNEIVDAKLEALKTEYETQRDNQQKLYDELILLTTKASSYTVQAYSEAIDEIASKMTQNGITLDGNYVDGLKGAQSQNNNNANSVASILGTKSATPIKPNTSLSALNQELAKMGYKTVNKETMVQLAQALKLFDIDGVEDVQDTTAGRINKNRILQAIKAAGFKSGDGIVLDNSMIKKAGEDRVTFAKVGEGLFSKDKVLAIQELTKAMPLMKDLVKLNTPDFSKIVTNNSASTNLYLTVTGVNDKSIVSNINTAGNNLLNNLSSEIRKRK